MDMLQAAVLRMEEPMVKEHEIETKVETHMEQPSKDVFVMDTEEDLLMENKDDKEEKKSHSRSSSMDELIECAMNTTRVDVTKKKGGMQTRMQMITEKYPLKMKVKKSLKMAEKKSLRIEQNYIHSMAEKKAKKDMKTSEKKPRRTTRKDKTFSKKKHTKLSLKSLLAMDINTTEELTNIRESAQLAKTLGETCVTLLRYMTVVKRMEGKDYPLGFTCHKMADAIDLPIRRVYDIIHILAAVGVFEHVHNRKLVKDSNILYWGPTKMVPTVKEIFGKINTFSSELELLQDCDTLTNSMRCPSLTIIARKLLTILIKDHTEGAEYVPLQRSRMRIMQAMEYPKDPSRRLYDVVSVLESCAVAEKYSAMAKKWTGGTAVCLSEEFSLESLAANSFTHLKTHYEFFQDIDQHERVSNIVENMKEKIAEVQNYVVPYPTIAGMGKNKIKRKVNKVPNHEWWEPLLEPQSEDYVPSILSYGTTSVHNSFMDEATKEYEYALSSLQKANDLSALQIATL